MRVRLERINAEYQKAISETLQGKVKDPRLQGVVSVTGVEVTNDLMHAKAFVSVYGSESEVAKAMEALKSSAGFIAREAGRKVQLRRVPQLHFERDTSIEYGAHISKLISDVLPPQEPSSEEAPQETSPQEASS